MNARLCLLRLPVENINIGTNFGIGESLVNKIKGSCIILGDALFLARAHSCVSDGWHGFVGLKCYIIHGPERHYVVFV